MASIAGIYGGFSANQEDGSGGRTKFFSWRTAERNKQERERDRGERGGVPVGGPGDPRSGGGGVDRQGGGDQHQMQQANNFNIE